MLGILQLSSLLLVAQHTYAYVATLGESPHYDSQHLGPPGVVSPNRHDSPSFSAPSEPSNNPHPHTTSTLSVNDSAAATPGAPTKVNVAVPSAVLQSCATTMNGQLPAATPPGWAFSGNVRKFYVAAEEVEWDYVPSGWDNWLGVPISDSVRAQRAGYLQYGTKWLKAFYRGYTDESFTKQSEQPPWQGSQGPTLRAEVGDMIEIMFVNNMTSNYATMHSMGLAYSKHSEGATYPNDTRPGSATHLDETNAVPPIDVGVEPRGCVVYKWMVTELAGPNNGEPARVHSYHSYVSLYEDANSGLIGPTIIYAPQKMQSTMTKYREFPLLYMIYSEAESFLSGINHERQDSGYHYSGIDIDTQNLPSGNSSVWRPELTNVLSAGQFSSAPNFHSMNGYIYTNNPPFEMCLGDDVIWYVNAYGSASHVFHMHGNGFRYQGEAGYAISINDGVGKTLYMNAAGLGLWQVLCHVDHHLSNGMVANYRVFDKGGCPLPPLHE